MKHRFYNQVWDAPLSAANDRPGWDNSTIGRLYQESGGHAYIEEIEGDNRHAPYCWRVVDARYSDEDGVMSYFRAYGLDGSPIAHPSFGVTWDGSPHKISGGFKHDLPAGRQYYCPDKNDFFTQNRGGYGVMVLDYDYPSETMHFGLKIVDDHRAMVISFQLFELRPGYPNDLEIVAE